MYVQGTVGTLEARIHVSEAFVCIREFILVTGLACNTMPMTLTASSGTSSWIFFFFFALCIELKLWLSEGPALKGLPTNLLTFNFVWQLAYHEYTHTHRYSVLVTILNVCVCFEVFNRMGPQISGISPGYTA